ncbi:MAG TPA: DUF3017 domain-containing protein [Arachnia sp.]|nr:DUF3017 domain-containing protein [Arachnia sp.]HMT87105.1 DUF3017 domain-containing protein [Arachnia sp.]
MAPNKPDKPVEFYPTNPWPAAASLALMAVGVGYAVAGHWKRASMAFAVSMALAGVLRLVLSREAAGLLVVRRKSIDVVVLFFFAIGIGALTLVVPPMR